jgi:hypothetical protein
MIRPIDPTIDKKYIFNLASVSSGIFTDINDVN